LHSAMTGL